MPCAFTRKVPKCAGQGAVQPARADAPAVAVRGVVLPDHKTAAGAKCATSGNIWSPGSEPTRRIRCRWRCNNWSGRKPAKATPACMPAQQRQQLARTDNNIMGREDDRPPRRDLSKNPAAAAARLTAPAIFLIQLCKFIFKSTPPVAPTRRRVQVGEHALESPAPEQSAQLPPGPPASPPVAPAQTRTALPCNRTSFKLRRTASAESRNAARNFSDFTSSSRPNSAADRAKLFQQFGGGLRPDARHAGNVVHRVAHQRQPVRHLLRLHAGFGPHLFAASKPPRSCRSGSTTRSAPTPTA